MDPNGGPIITLHMKWDNKLYHILYRNTVYLSYDKSDDVTRIVFKLQPKYFLPTIWQRLFFLFLAALDSCTIKVEKSGKN